MASAVPSLASTKETTNYARLCRLLVDVGSQAFRDTFDSIHPPAGLHHVLARHPEHATLQSLHTARRRVINPTQWGKLYPTIPSSVSSAGFDITLLMILLRNICGLHPPATGWDNLPPPADTSREANIARVKYYRNSVYGHASQASVDDATFNTYWQDISTVLVALGGASYGAAINKLKNEFMDPDTEEHYRELLKQWKKDEDKLVEIEVKQGTPTDNELEVLGAKIERQWVKLGRRLGIRDEMLQEIRQAHAELSERGYYMLKNWKQKQGSDATYRALCEALKHDLVERQDLADQFCYIKKELQNECKEEKGNFDDKLREVEDKIRNDIEQLNEKLLAHMAEMEGSSSKDKDEIRDDLKQMKSEIQNISEKLNCKMSQREETTDDENTRGNLEQMKVEIGNINEKLESLMNQLPPVRKKPRFEDTFDPTELIDGIRQLYKLREGWLAPFPWCEEFHFHLDNVYTRLKVISRKKERGTATANTVDMSEIFKPHEECSQPRTVLIEGTPGMGKTTYCKKLVYDWATGNQQAEDGFPRFEIVLLLRCRDMKSDLWKAIDDQLLPRDVKEDVRERFFDFIRQNQSNVLLILDGLDEVTENKLPIFSEILQGRVLPKCRLVATARHEAGKKVRIHCDTLLEIEGFTEKEVQNFIVKYFKTREDLAQKLLLKLRNDKKLKNLSRNPLNTALLCLFCEDSQGEFPKNRGQLFQEVVQCILRRYRKKEGLPETEDDLLEVYKTQLKHLGWIALEGLRKDSLDFEKSKLANHSKDIPRFGFLSVQSEGSKLRPCCRYSFLHKSFQEWFAAFYLCCQLVEGVSPDKLLDELRIDYDDDDSDEKDDDYYLNKEHIHEVLSFVMNLLATRCEELAVALIKSMAARVPEISSSNIDFWSRWCFRAISFIKEFKRDNSKLFVKLSRAFGSSLECEDLNFRVYYLKFDSDGIAVLAEALKVNKCWNRISVWAGRFGRDDDDGAISCLANAIKGNSTLTTLELGYYDIHEDGVSDLANALKVNTTLTELILFNNGIGDQGAARFAEALKENKTLTKLHLGRCDIGKDGGANLADALQVNTTLTELNLDDNEIGDQGATRFAEALKVNKTLTKLYLGCCVIGKDGSVDLADALKVNTTLTELNLRDKEIGDQGAARLAQALKENRTLTKLHLTCCDIGKDGSADLANALKVNTTLTELILFNNKIGYQGAARFAEALRVNKTLTKLDLDNNRFDVSCAVCLADALKSNTGLIELDLSGINIDMDGISSLVDALKHNATLAKLHLGGINRLFLDPANFDDPREKAVVTEFLRLIIAGRIYFPRFYFDR